MRSHDFPPRLLAPLEVCPSVGCKSQTSASRLSRCSSKNVRNRSIRSCSTSADSVAAEMLRASVRYLSSALGVITGEVVLMGPTVLRSRQLVGQARSATRPPQPAPPLGPVRRKRRITTPMDWTPVETSASSPPRGSLPRHYNQAISVLNPLLGPQSAQGSYQSTTNSINTNPITGGQRDPNDQHRIRHRDRQPRHHVRRQIYVGTVPVVCRRPIHPAGEPGEPVGHWRPGHGRLCHERRGRQQSRFSQARADLVDGREIRDRQKRPISPRPGIISCRTTSVFPRPARPQVLPRFLRGQPEPGIALLWIITSPRVSTLLPELRFPM